MRMSAYGRKQTLRLSLDECSFTSALEKKADIRVLELRAKANGRNRPKRVAQLLGLERPLPAASQGDTRGMYSSFKTGSESS